MAYELTIKITTDSLRDHRETLKRLRAFLLTLPKHEGSVSAKHSAKIELGVLPLFPFGIEPDDLDLSRIHVSFEAPIPAEATPPTEAEPPPAAPADDLPRREDDPIDPPDAFRDLLG